MEKTIRRLIRKLKCALGFHELTALIYYMDIDKEYHVGMTPRELLRLQRKFGTMFCKHCGTESKISTHYYELELLKLGK